MTSEPAPPAFLFRRLTENDARTIAGWRYAGEYALYDPGEGSVQAFLEPAFDYFAAVDTAGELVGYCCFGQDARVAGLAEDEGTLDVGGGLRPDLTGIGLGAEFLRASCELGASVFRPRSFRVVIASFNERAQRVAAALGFEPAGHHSAGERDYVLLTRPG